MSLKPHAVYVLIIFLFPFLFLACGEAQPSREALSAYLSAKRHYEEQRLQTAFQEFKAIADQNPAFYQARLMQGKTAFFLGRTDESIAILGNLGTQHPDYFEAQYYLAKAFQTSGKLLEAENVAARLLSMNTEDFRLNVLMAQLRVADNRLPDAIDFYRKALLVREDLARAHISLAKLYQQQGATPQAVIEIDQAIRMLAPDSPLLSASQKIKSTLEEKSK